MKCKCGCGLETNTYKGIERKYITGHNTKVKNPMHNKNTIKKKSGKNHHYFGKKRKKEEIEKIRKSLIGRKASDETKKKLSLVHKGKLLKKRKYNDLRNSYKLIAFWNFPKKCNYCGNSDLRVLEVHHKDNNRKNNKLENLEILCANCHVIKHKPKIPKYKL